MRLKLVVVFLVTSAFGFFFYTNWQTLHKPFTHDEVDYVVCAEKGIWHNAFGVNTLLLKEFVALGKLKKEGDGHKIAQYAATLPNPNADVFVLRHYHPPLPVYYWSLFNTSNTLQHEQWLRLSNWMLLLFTAALFFVLLGKNGNITALMVSLVFVTFLLADLTAFSFNTLHFHSFLGLFCVLFLFALLQFLSNQSSKNVYILAGSISLMLLSLESALIVLGITFLVLFFTGNLKKFSVKSALLLVAVSAFFVALLWPAFITKGELIKSVGMYVSRIFINDNLEYNQVSHLQNWKEIILLAPVLCGLFLFAQVVAIKNVLRSKNKNLLIPFAIGWGYCLLMTPFILNKTYVLPGVFMLVFASANTFVQVAYTKKLGSALVLFALVSVLLIGFTDANKWYKTEEGIAQREQFALVKELSKQGRVLIFPGHVFQYYAKDAAIESLGHPKINFNAFTHRYDYSRSDISQKIESGYYYRIIFPAEERFAAWKKKLLEMGLIMTNDVPGYYSFCVKPN